jgi:Flp pilus assembly protein TadG
VKRHYWKARLYRVRARADEGASIVEFAFSFMILCIMLFGIMDMALCFYTYNFVAETAREATRYASVRGSACTGFSDCAITQTQLAAYVQNRGYPGINPTALTVTATVVSGGNNKPGNPVTVTVSYQFPMAVPFLQKKTWTLTSTSQMVISQ